MHDAIGSGVGRHRHRRKPCAYGRGEWVLLLGCCVCHGGLVGDAAALGALIVDDLAQAAVLEEHMLAGDEAVGCRGERVAQQQHGSRSARVVDAGVAVAGDAQAEVVDASRFDGEADVRRQDDVAHVRCTSQLDCAAIEAEEQRVLCAGV